MNKFRWWLVRLLVGDSSYIKNCSIEGTLVLRRKHVVDCCSFSKTGIVRIGSIELTAIEAFK